MEQGGRNGKVGRTGDVRRSGEVFPKKQFSESDCLGQTVDLYQYFKM